jgi:hypothetical protein
VVALAGLALVACVAAGAGEPLRAARIQYKDPVSGFPVTRLTTDGAREGVINSQGDLSGEASAFSPDSRSVVFAKCCGRGEEGATIIVLDLAGGPPRALARTAIWNPYPVFSRDGAEVYFYDRAGREVVIQAARTDRRAVRRVAGFPGADWQEKIGVNADGTLLSAHVRSGGVWRTHIIDPAGRPAPGWDPSVPSTDGDLWNPVHPERLMGRRGDVMRAWNVRQPADTSWKWTCQRCDPAHAAWHPDGELYYAGGYLVNARTGAELGGTGIPPIHPFFHPLHRERGLDARVTADEAPWFFSGRGRPLVYAPTLRQALTGDFRHSPVAVHDSSYRRNSSHPHPHFSPDGRYVLFASDVASTREPLPPGQDGPGVGGVDLFLVEVPESWR